MPYALATLAEWIGAAFHRLLLLGAGGIAAGLWLTGTVRRFRWPPLPADPALERASPRSLMLLCHLQLGYAAAWLGTPAPLFWIWQKMTFVLGGLMIPLTLYPAPCGSLAAASPFAAMLFAPASFLLDPSPRAILAHARRCSSSGSPSSACRPCWSSGPRRPLRRARHMRRRS